MKKYLFSSLALSTMLVGCSQEELAPKVDNVETGKNIESVVGHDLLGPLTIKIGAETRALNGQWEDSDKLGLAWYDVEGDITALQTQKNFDAKATTDNNIYGNHLFVKGNGGFTTQTNVYQGAHFVYFPFERAVQVAQKSVELNEKPFGASKNAEQTDFQYERYNNMFYMSTADFVTEKDVDADMKLVKQFTLSPVANVININTTPVDNVASQEVLKNFKITSYNIAASTEVFEDEFAIVTKDVPVAQYVKNEDGTFKLDDNGKKILDVTANIAELDKYAEAIEGTAKKAVGRTVSAAYTAGVEHDLPVFVLPVSGWTTNNKDLTIKINVKTASGMNGYFTIANPNGLANDAEGASKNTIAINILDVAMSNGGVLTKIARTKEGDWTFPNINVELGAANFTLDDSISSYAEWVDAVNIYNALGYTKTFVVDGVVEFKETIPTLTTGKIVVKTVDDGEINIAGAVTLPVADKLDLTTNAPAIEVAATGNLTIEDNVELANNNVINNGIINLGKLSKLGIRPTDSTPGTGIDNTNGRVNVVYGSYAYLATTKEGVVAYNVPYEYKIYQLDYLTKKNNTKGEASVNTFVVGYEGNQRVELDVNAFSKENNDDPYNPGSTTSEMPSLSNITIEMEGGKIFNDTNSPVTVKAIKVLKKDNNEVVGITVNEDITVANETAAEITGGAANGNINNDGTLKLMDVTMSKDNKTVITNNGEMTVNATKVLIDNVPTAVYTATASKLENKANFTVSEGVLKLTIDEIKNASTGKIEADNTKQVYFGKMYNDGTLVRITQ